MSEAAAYLRQLDDAWEHQWESLKMALHGLDADEAAWQAPAYRDEPAEDGWPLPGSAQWHIAHLTHCKLHYAAVIRGRAAEAPSPEPRKPVAGFDEELEALARAHAEEREAFAGVRDEDLDIVAGGKMPLREFLSMAVRHDTWHAGQLVVARRLQRKAADSA